MATVITRYVNTASSGGDGTTNNTSGTDAAYANLNAGLADVAADFPNFVTSDVQVDILCTGSASDTTGITIPTITTDATRFLRIKAQAGDKASLAGWSTNKYRISPTSINTINIVNTKYIRFEDIQIENRNTANNSNSIVQWNTGNGVDASAIYLINCRLRKPSGYSTTGHKGITNLATGAGALFLMVNCLVEGLTTTSCIGAQTGDSGSNGEVTAYNTLVVDAPIGFSTNSANKGKLKNCRTASCADGYSGTFDATCTDNASDLASDAPGTDPHNSITNAFTNAGAGDYTYTGSDGGIDLGIDLSGDSVFPFNYDMEGNSRGATWDVGPYEVSGGTLHTQSFGGSVTPSGITSFKVEINGLEGNISPAGSFIRQTNKQVAGSISPAGSFATLLIPAGTLYTQGFGGDLAPVGEFGRQTNKILAGSVSPTGTFSTVLFSPTLHTQSFGGTITPTGRFQERRVMPYGSHGVARIIGYLLRRWR